MLSILRFYCWLDCWGTVENKPEQSSEARYRTIQLLVVCVGALCVFLTIWYANYSRSLQISKL